MDVPGHEFVAYFYGRYSKVESLTLIEHSMQFATSAAEFAAQEDSDESHRVVAEFESRGDSSGVRFSQYGELPDGEPARAKAGMESYFDSLAEFLA